MIEFPDTSWKDYELLDSGDGEKLERFGSYVLWRPEPKALWGRSLPLSEWSRLPHTRFKPGAGFGRAGKEDSGTWERLHKMDDQWWIRYALPAGGGVCSSDFASLIPPTADAAGPSRSRSHGRLRSDEQTPSPASISLRLGLTSFKHVGVFPEQAPNWDFIYRKCSVLEAPKVLNLFAYTGGASLAAKAAGAEVTHLDSVRQVVTWARQNMERSGLDGIRWIVEDAMKFARREARRGNLYDGIILDPPAYGHGPDWEKWKLDECLFEMLRTVATILAPHGFVVLNLYSNGYSAALGETLVREAFGIPGLPAAAVPPGPEDFAPLIPPTADAAGPSR
ncbi:MAG: class I SAM-dependent methyltransferase, partial [Bacteroidales bacterium]|nr:class I SAM-dependent methyltransferase [Bacteroidales bacterium]